MRASSGRTLSSVVLTVAAACGYSLPAVAGDGPGCQKQQMVQDVEGNGQLTAASHVAGAAKRFEMMDADKDGKVTAAEIGASRGAEAIAWATEDVSASDKIRKLDANRDGALSAKEYADGSQAMFKSLDADGDGVLTPDEMYIPSKVGAR
jgi:hypothetical protein